MTFKGVINGEWITVLEEESETFRHQSPKKAIG
jgi:hypothetical protein